MIHVRTYGNRNNTIVLLHGGPAAPGYMAPLARQLAESFRVLEPFQRGSSDTPLTVATHIDDLHEVLSTMCPDTLPALIGHSWGAMLALAYAAEHPKGVASIVLIGCGTFDAASRNRLVELREERTTDNMRERLARLEREIRDPDQRLAAMGDIAERIDAYDPIALDEEPVKCDSRAHEETWNDMLRLQAEGVYPSAFSAIKSPVIMLHGAYDIHPGRMIRDSLLPHMPQLEYREWEKCGHYPWKERQVHEEFVEVLRSWLKSHF